MKLKGLKKAIGEYKRANAEGPFSPRYGFLMLDKSTGEIWCDEFYDLGHSWHNYYHDSNIIDLVADMYDKGYDEKNSPITMQTVKAFCAKYYGIG